VDLLIQSFRDDPLINYIFPSKKEKDEHFPIMMRHRAKQGFDCGEVFATSSRFEGIAIWNDPDKEKRSFFKDLRSGGFKLLRTVRIERIRVMMRVAKFTNERRAKYAIAPYLHLGPVAVAPEYQGQGYASSLIRPMLQHLDTEGLNCYLEAQTETNVSIYQHYGFEIVAEEVVPGTDIQRWAMIRTPIK